ncbi:GNAT family N-acetyltransferase [uncultured Ruegeria sp.]|uniref:GNAT family N-acetyltransferase n=1 Tax=uncultured Ruegeria sp. TaxID=259304 RepID=UPI0026310920|nr:GNAT family N-acetyltransferase [uncultured Ruegeria sp.]
MTPQDMAHIHAAAFRQSRPWIAEEFTELLANRFIHVVGDKRSFALVQVIADEAELLTIATHPDHQRLGLARQIMADFHGHAKKIGASRAFLDVASDNMAAIALYEGCGYMACGKRKSYYLRENGPNVDAIVMECRLNDK